jgi:hypothetical protein
MKVSVFTLDDHHKTPEIHALLRCWTSRDTMDIIYRMHTTGNFRVLQDTKEQVLAVCGFVETHEGVCEVVLIPCLSLAVNYQGVCKFLKRGLTELLNTYHRIQMVCKDSDEHHRFAEFLGFKEEGILRQYNINGDDYVMYSIVR